MADTQSTEAFVQLLIAHQNSIYAYVLATVGNPVDAQDVLQETNLVLWRKAGDFKLGTNFAAWATTHARFQVKSFRSRCSRGRLEFDEDVLARLTSAYGDIKVDLSERQIFLRQCLDQFDAKDRESLAKRYAPGGSVKELAIELNRTPVATSAYLMRLRRKLFNCIQEKLSKGGLA